MIFLGPRAGGRMDMGLEEQASTIQREDRKEMASKQRRIRRKWEY